MNTERINIREEYFLKAKILAMLPIALFICITVGFSVAYSTELGDGYSSGSGAPPECIVDTVAPPAYVQTIGRGAPSQSSPVAIAVSSDSYLYILDETNHRVLKFDSSGGYVSQWGSYGTGDGQFAHPRGIAVDSMNNIYVTENNNNRVQKFSSTGSFITKWGTYGTGDGQLHGPSGIAADSDDNIYIVDTNNNRVQKFNSSGDFIAKWGTYGTGDGQFNAPRGMYIDETDKIYIADSSNHRVQKFDLAGGFIAKWGSFGTGDGQFSTPQAITGDSSENIYVSDTNNNRIQRFSSSGEFVSKWGSLGSNVGQLFSPRGIIIDSSNSMYVADSGNRRMQKLALGEGGDYTSTKYAQSGPTEALQDDGMYKFSSTAGGSQDVYSLTNFAFTVPFEATIVSIQAEYEDYMTGGGVGGASGYLQLWKDGVLVGSQKDMTISTDNAVYMTSSDLWNTTWTPTEVNSSQFGVRVWISGYNRSVYVDYVKLIISYSVSVDVTLVISTDGYSGQAQFSNPQGTAVDAAGNVYVVDTDNDRIQKFNAEGVFLDEWGSTGFGSGQFSSPVGIALDDEEHVYITDLGNRRIQKFDLSGNHIASISTGYPSSPSAIAIDSLGNIYVTDIDAYINNVKKYDAAGSLLTEWGYPGSADGAFNNPTGIAIGSNGHILVVDRHNSRVQKFDSSGSFISKWGSGGSGDGQFSVPQGVAVDATGNVYVSEAGNDRIQKFDSSGNFITKWGAQGTNNGFFDNPYGLYVDGLDNVYVADAGNNRIQKFTYEKVTVSNSESVDEGGNTKDYSIVLNVAPSSDVVVRLSVEDPTTGSSISISPNELTFTPSDWNISQQVTISPEDDSSYTGSRHARISYTISSVDASFNCLILDNTNVSIEEDETLPIALNQPAPTLPPEIQNRLDNGYDANGECIMQRPGGRPDVFRIDMTDTTATLYIAPPTKPYTHFYITYKELGVAAQQKNVFSSRMKLLSSLIENPVYAESPEYAVDFSHENNGGVVVYTINDLKPNTRYEFTIKCSNKCAFAETGNTLAASTIVPGSSAFKTYLAYQQNADTQMRATANQLVETGSPAYVSIVAGFVLMILGIGVYLWNPVQFYDPLVISPHKYTLKHPRVIRYIDHM